MYNTICELATTYLKLINDMSAYPQDISRHLTCQGESSYDKNDRMDHYHKHKKSDLPVEILDKARVKCYGKVKNCEVWTVDGEILRDEVDVDFTTGANGARYRYTPEDEIWVEQTLRPSDFMPVIIHECIERCHMMNDEMSYNDAHDKANIHEKKIRKMLDMGKIHINNYDEAVIWANEYLQKLNL